MTIKTLPKAMQSAFRPACFVLSGAGSPQTAVDVAINTQLQPGAPIGTKRLYPAPDGTVSVNVAPYLRGFFDVKPIFRETSGPGLATGRLVPCSVSAAGYTSPIVQLGSGTEDIPTSEILSAAPSHVTVGPTDMDEVALVTTAKVIPELVMHYWGDDYVERTMSQIASTGMIAVSIDVADCIRRLKDRVRVPEERVNDFILRLRLVSGSVETVLERHYTIDKERTGGVRLAWVNRYGAIDFHTFPTIEAVRTDGKKQTHTLVSEVCDEGRAKWLSEIFSSPRVWRADGKTLEQVTVADGEVVASPLKPTYVSLSITPATKTPSRK